MLYVRSGCSGGGKTTLVNALASRGFGISDEPGRHVVREELHTGGSALPWTNPVMFSEKCAELSVHRHTAAIQAGAVVFFDRSLVDAVSALVYEEPDRAETHLRSLEEHRYASTVFIAPPWSEKFENDPERQHDYKHAVAEYDRLVLTYTLADYSILICENHPLRNGLSFFMSILNRLKELFFSISQPVPAGRQE